MEKKHVLIIEGFPPPHWWLIENGYKITWMNTVDRIRDRKGYNRKIGIPVNATVEEWVSLAKAVHSFDPFDSIINCREANQDITYFIAKALGLKWHDINVIESVNNKFMMRKKFDLAGIHNLKFDLIKNKEVLDKFTDECRFPIVLKPLSASGSKGIHVVNNKRESFEAFRNMKNMGIEIAIAEEFIEGDEYSVEAFSQNGEHYVLCVTKKYKNAITCVETGHSLPAKLNKEIEKEIINYVRQALTILEVDTGITHTELFITKDGPIIVESHLRMGGDCIPILIKEALNIDMIDIWMNAIVEDKNYVPVPQSKEDQFAAVWFKESQVEGKVVAVNNIAEVEEMEGVIKIELQKKVNDIVIPTIDSSSRLCFVITKAKCPEKALNIAKSAIEKINYVIE
jgi:phosphoribosylamine-glycine ligase